jgi:hypothetical protein
MGEEQSYLEALEVDIAALELLIRSRIKRDAGKTSEAIDLCATALRLLRGEEQLALN